MKHNVAEAEGNNMADLGDNPDALAAIVESLGGTPIPARTFQFDLPMSLVREAVPRLSQLTGLRVEKVSERTESGDSAGIDRVQTIARLELRRKPQEPSEYEKDHRLMAALFR
jgi:hypothetical protein